MAPVNGAPSRPTKTPAKRTVYPPAIPHIYTKKRGEKKDEKNENKTPQSNGCVNGNQDSQPSSSDNSQSLNGNANGQPSLSENGQTATVGPSPVESAAAVVASAHVAPSNASVDSRTVVAATNGHPQAAPVALPNPAEEASPTVLFSNAPSMNGHGLEFSPVEHHPGPFHQPHPSNGHHHQLSNGSFVQSLQDSRFPSPIPHFQNGSPHNPMPHLDRTRHPAAIRPHGDAYAFPAFVESNGPLTAGSFQDSQSSSLPDDLHRRLFPAMNGIPFPDRNGHGPMHANGPVPASDIIKQNLQHQADTMLYLQSATVTPEFTDCILELHFPSAQAFSDHHESHRLQRVLRLPAHRFILARSPLFRQAMQEQELAPGGVLVFHLVGRYMRSDVVGAVIRSLYGWPLDGYIPYTELAVRNSRDHMMLMLSYMAIGQFLKLPYVFGPAMQRAMTLFDWDTVALAIDLALPSVVMPDRGVGPFGLAELMDQATRFIILEFPHDFVLDVTVGDSEVPRLPRLSGRRSNSGGSSQGPPMLDGQRLAELQNIRFGDLSAAEQNGQAPPQRVPEPVNTVVSRILLNLPYEYLKAILEAPSLGRTSDLVRRLPIFDIIAEREARRKHALSTSRPELRAALESTTAPPVVKGELDFHINAMGFKEEVCLGDMPYLIHTWTVSPAGSDTA